MATRDELRSIFAEGYGLYAHAPGRDAEKARQGQYARWLLGSIADGLRVLEVGCGNGSLLAELAALLPSSRFSGIEPSPEAAAHARAAGLEVVCGFGEDLPAGASMSDVVLSVNVLEHTLDPVGFLGALAARTRPGGRVIVVCPDGERPAAELLFFDHLYSFTRAALDGLLARSGLRRRGWSMAPSTLGAFQMVVAEAGEAEAREPTIDPDALGEARTAYLSAWHALDETLAERCGPRPITCFGAGEAARVLRAYAPRTWSRVARLVEDRPAVQALDGVPVIPFAELDRDAAGVVLLAVRPQDQPKLADRLGAILPVVRWDDLVAA
jgi:SAM-dependent methyltransferase